MNNTRRYEHDEKTNTFYHSIEWRSIRESALKRDHYLCQVCRRNGIIKQGNTVHHIIPIKNDWSKRLDMDNLETICPSCHNQEHFEKGFSSKKKRLDRKKGVAIFGRNPDL
ncbi:HNH endonuclease [Lactobacillus plantarum]|uniref:HNH endonuclease n=1 Tax=Lactiplantibacillus plantarum TaxID=1590 RepID=UPI00143CD379|nr:HNH endonuclease signature motif containing protein [Lactiplantibacillus plantarum]MBE1727410.1 HNH endonuclease [Lactiplantibacillus plantarum]NKI39441.1 HNH endonuclease [Lactiplantibacillus plantarum]